MRRTTTATHRLTFPISLQTVTDMQITYAQNGNIVIVKDLEDVTIDDKKATIELSQEETKLFEAEKPVELQAKILLHDDTIIASKIKRIPATRILNDTLFGGEDEETPTTNEETTEETEPTGGENDD